MSLKRELGESNLKRNCRYEVIKGVETPSLVIHFCNELIIISYAKVISLLGRRRIAEAAVILSEESK